ncbi:DUF4829 domain-containing protein [Clostridium sp. JN-1]|uniref:DUF4829 domain-containing protein n=1 Tax=Clostridium sp. JN-1 TaxID=2483110 RepID=UPI000F0BB51E|nr:DUF4829 domain-containing protein [Clostridium sp. JN-1]
MKFKLIFTCITLSVLLTIVGCTEKTQNTNSTKDSTTSKQVVNNKSNSKDSLDAQKVVENYFKYMNEKNVDAVQKTLINNDERLSECINSIDYMKLISIEEDTDPELKEPYLYDVKGKAKEAKEAKAANIKVFNVFYDAKYKEEGGAQKSGKDQKWFWVVRKDKNSPWVIQGMGQP